MNIGIIELDKIINIDEPKLSIISGKAGVGKSTILEKVIYNIAIKQNISTVLFNLESSKDKIILDLKNIDKNNKLKSENYENIASTIIKLPNTNLFIEDIPKITVEEIENNIKNLKNKYDVKFVGIDYLQLVTLSKNSKLGKQQEMLEIMKQLKNISLKYKINIGVVTVISCDTNETNELIKKNYTQYADIILILNRDKLNNVEIIIAKNNTDRLGNLKME